MSLASLRRTVDDLSEQVADAIGEVNRTADAKRALRDAQDRRSDALNELGAAEFRVRSQLKDAAAEYAEARDEALAAVEPFIAAFERAFAARARLDYAARMADDNEPVRPRVWADGSAPRELVIRFQQVTRRGFDF